ncbi:MAG: hypothetical protein KDB45_11125 [Mycobacterium sp.]|nr:hypothetical protein [Mycobacterium sp.]
MEAAFGDRIAPAVGNSATPADLWAINKNVIVVYNNAAVVAAGPPRWPDGTPYRPYVAVQSALELLARNDGNLATFPAGIIWAMFGENSFNAVSLVTGVLTVGPGSNEQMAGRATMLAGYPRNTHWPVQQWIRSDFKSSANLVKAGRHLDYWPAGATSARRRCLLTAYGVPGWPGFPSTPGATPVPAAPPAPPVAELTAVASPPSPPSPPLLPGSDPDPPVPPSPPLTTGPPVASPPLPPSPPVAEAVPPPLPPSPPVAFPLAVAVAVPP